ncbi:AMP-binding protein [Parasphingopyxis lamellibrachiae]|uniref:Malonyl-CoA/methylmalonyl-CoA synthetase n=1 Tax=Parasphingopyxis lamellibrachiae TaxID=680125 RepID=A0A3D9FIW1_9SPHN|nr:AMP-binding protein [Parasphingopyxis lamellibrachiae]RED17522.1 malonyl-CoA/methylmalonyl-CoA synthetase [Parasphingopyxis lamellibrachiae]
MNANLYSMFAETANRAGSKPLIVERGETGLRFDELDAVTARWAATLSATGAQPGDRIVVQVEKSVENILLYLASLRAGLVYVPLNTAYTPTELEYFVGDAEPAIIVCDPANAAAIGPLAGAATLLTLGANGRGSLADHATSHAAESFETVVRQPDDLAAILYTSGTTGLSKGAMLSHDNLASNALVLQDYWRWRGNDVLIHALPIYHVHGLFVALHLALLGGSTIRFHRAFDADAILADMAGATVLMGVPTFYVRLADHAGLTRGASSTMRLFISGSAPLLESTFAAFETKTGHRILERYGMTEAGMITSNPYDGERIPGTVGFALPGVSARIADDSGAEVERDTPGILEMKGPNLFRGYWKKPDKTAEEMRPDGYFITGDIATMDAEGRVAIVGRAKDLIIAGGLNIYPKEIELALDAVSGVIESAVVGISHPDLGEAVVAVVVREDETLEKAAILSAISDQLARFKQPRHILFAEALPRNAMGKVQKAKLRDQHSGLFAS